MNWKRLNIKKDLDEMIGMHVLVKGRNTKTGKEFYTTGYVERYDGEIILKREEDLERGYIDCFRTFTKHCDYWIINIDEIA